MAMEQGRQRSSSGPDSTTVAWFDHATAPRVATDAVIARSLKEEYPGLELAIIPTYNVPLLPYAQAGFASFKPMDDSATNSTPSSQKEKKDVPSSLMYEMYFPPSRRLDGARGGVASQLFFGKFEYTWQGATFIIYLADGRDGMASYPQMTNYYILATPTERPKVEALVIAAGFWANDLHDEVWVFDGGYWNKSRELFESVRTASWDNVILDEGMKKALIDDHLTFFGSRDSYQKLKVPWKRGLILYGPPGNGKTISIKAMMHTLYNLKVSVPTLYVRSLQSWMGPEASIAMIFGKAREFAPCYLVLEDLDTIVNDSVRSYFLNEVDGLKPNDGIFMVGSTNHLDRLDPGISKRPSRFDRKYLFPDPDLKERTQYAHFWQKKLEGNEEIEFPDELCGAIAEITGGFSFAYMQEGFVACLLAIARRNSDGEMVGEDEWVAVSAPSSPGRRSDDGFEAVGGDDDDEHEHKELDHLVLWREMKKQVKILRLGMDEKAVLEQRRGAFAADLADLLR